MAIAKSGVAFCLQCPCIELHTSFICQGGRSLSILKLLGGALNLFMHRITFENHTSAYNYIFIEKTRLNHLGFVIHKQINQIVLPAPEIPRLTP